VKKFQKSFFTHRIFRGAKVYKAGWIELVARRSKLVSNPSGVQYWPRELIFSERITALDPAVHVHQEKHITTFEELFRLFFSVQKSDRGWNLKRINNCWFHTVRGYYCNRQVALEGWGLEREGAKRLTCGILNFSGCIIRATFVLIEEGLNTTATKFSVLNRGSTSVAVGRIFFLISQTNSTQFE